MAKDLLFDFDDQTSIYKTCKFVRIIQAELIWRSIDIQAVIKFCIVHHICGNPGNLLNAKIQLYLWNKGANLISQGSVAACR